MQIAMQTAFDHNGIFDAHAKTPPIADDAGAAQVATPTPIALPMPSAAETAQHTEQRIQAVLKKQAAARQTAAAAITIKASPEGLVVSLHEAGFFPSGSAELRPESWQTLRALASALPRQPMRVEGHTDNIPIHTPQFATNWELSTARAAVITRLLIAQQAADPSEITAAGQAEFHPTATNQTEAGRAQNRRVDIILLTSQKP